MKLQNNQGYGSNITIPQAAICNATTKPNPLALTNSGRMINNDSEQRKGGGIALPDSGGVELHKTWCSGENQVMNLQDPQNLGIKKETYFQFQWDPSGSSFVVEHTFTRRFPFYFSNQDVKSFSAY